MKKDTGLTFVVTIAALIALLATSRLANSLRSASRKPIGMLAGYATATDTAAAEKKVAFLIAKQALSASLVAPEKAKWCDVNEASYQKTQRANYVALQVEVENGRGECVPEHWIIQLEPNSNRVVSQVCREEAIAIGSMVR